MRKTVGPAILNFDTPVVLARVAGPPVRMEAVLTSARGLREDDPEAWRPSIMSFCRFYGPGPQPRRSTLAEIAESMYRSQLAPVGRCG